MELAEVLGLLSSDSELKLWASFEDWLSQKLGISQEFLSKLKTDDDWTLAIKLHAMLETGLNHLLVSKLKRANLAMAASVIPLLPNSDQKSGKLAFVKELCLLPKEHIVFIQKFSELRNFLVHDACNFATTLAKYPERFKVGGERNAWYTALSLGYSHVARYLNKEQRIELAKNNPQAALRSACWIIMRRIFGGSGDYPPDGPSGPLDLESMSNQPRRFQFQVLRPLPLL